MNPLYKVASLVFKVSASGFIQSQVLKLFKWTKLATDLLGFEIFQRALPSDIT